MVLVALCFGMSGFSALVYQTAWMRLFSITFGTSEAAIAIVLAGYMAGLAIGAAVASRYVDRVQRPVFVFGVLEGMVAVTALAMPFLIDLAGYTYVAIVGGQPSPPDASTLGQTLFYTVATLLILFLPTAFMGATLPLLSRYVVTTNQNLGNRIAILYSTNTLGAVLGVLVAGFILLPT
ncbi:MAG: fused MFS/spermidine synthase, partial [Pseudomonadales bacterium]